MAKPKTATQSEPYPTPMRSTIVPLTVQCAHCGVQSRATAYTVKAGPMPSFTWLRMPNGWWALLSDTFLAGRELGQLHCRCPSCLRCGADAIPRERSDTDDEG